MAQGGKTLNDRKLAASVRTLGLRELERILKLDDCEYKREIMKKLAPTLLPRLNEHTGEDGEKLTVNFDPVFKGDAITRETKEHSPEPGEI